MSARGALMVGSALVWIGLTGLAAQRPGAFGGNRDHPAINYTAGAVADEIAALNQHLEAGKLVLQYDDAGAGYLRSVLDALRVPVSSQVLVFSETSIQARKINRGNPRAIYFSDTVAVGWVRGGDMIEVAAHDPHQGTVFYTLPQQPSASPRFERNDTCLACHLSWETLAVPGFVLQTVFPRRSDRDYADGGFVDHRLPVEERWGGWFVTGRMVPARHMGNQSLLQPTPRTGPAQKLTTVDGEFDVARYLTNTSDVVALAVLDHQVHAANLITRLDWEARAGTPERVAEAADELADYLLFVDEAPFPGRVEGTSGFARDFEQRGPKDGQGRSLRTLRLDGRLLEYPLSYMVGTPAFDALTPVAADAVRERLVAVLTGRDTRPRYAHLTPSLRTAIVEILRATKPGFLPPA